MGTPDQFPGPAEYGENKRHNLDLALFHAASQLITEIGEFAATINANQYATSSEFVFMFYDESLDNVEIPAAVKEVADRYGVIDAVDVIYGYYNHDPRSYATLHFYIVDEADDHTELLLAPFGPYGTHPRRSDVLTIISEQDTVTKEHGGIITVDEINLCIASLIYQGSGNNKSLLSLVNFNDGKAYKAITELLKLRANDFLETATYDLHDADGAKEGMVQCVIEGNDLREVELQRFTRDELFVADDGSIHHDRQAISAKINLSAGSPIRLSLLEGTDELSAEPTAKPLFPKIDEYTEMLSLIRRQGLAGPNPENYLD